jgi:hypothetical protein
MTAVLAEMDGNTVSTRLFTNASRLERVRLARRTAAIAGLPQGRDVIDIDSEF